MIENLIWLALCVYFEAMGESFEGQKAVAHVVLNRVKKEEKSVKDVVLRPWQFSWANQGVRPPIKNYAAFVLCSRACYQALVERLDGKDFFGADHYYNPAKASPKWDFTKLKFIKEIGGHKFYKHL